MSETINIWSGTPSGSGKTGGLRFEYTLDNRGTFVIIKEAKPVLFIESTKAGRGRAFLSKNLDGSNFSVQLQWYINNNQQHIITSGKRTSYVSGNVIATRLSEYL